MVDDDDAFLARVENNKWGQLLVVVVRGDHPSHDVAVGFVLLRLAHDPNGRDKQETARRVVGLVKTVMVVKLSIK